VELTTDGKSLVSHAGTAPLTEPGDRNGLTKAMKASTLRQPSEAARGFERVGGHQVEPHPNA
jgi:hypothetical protein